MRKRLSFALVLLLAASSSRASSAGVTRFVLDGNRMYAELGFVRPDGSIHKALAFVDMGSQFVELRASLFKELGIDRRTPLVFRVGTLSVEVPGADVTSEPREPSSIGDDLKVEGVLPASVLKRFQVEIDYGQRTLRLANSPVGKPDGVAVPVHLNPQTGLIAVDIAIGGDRYPITIDNGSAYTWVRQRVANGWLRNHHDWERGVGAVGPSNMMMSGDATETAGVLMRIPEVSLGSLTVANVGVLAAAPGRLFPDNLDLFDWYSRKNALPVIGWIGGNVLKNFRITIDYPDLTIYFVRQSGSDSHDLDQIGLTLRAESGAFFVAGIATKDGRPTVDGVRPGDKLVRVGGLDTSAATWGAIYAAMHGKPGDRRPLVVERHGARISIDAVVTAF